MIINFIYFFKLKNNLTIIKSLLIQIATLIILLFIPITNIWVKFNFWFYKDKRVEVIEKILQNSLTPNVEYNKRLIKLNDNYPTLSYGGNEIVVNEYNGKKYILFFMFRGILDNYTALLYILKDGDIREYKKHFMGKNSKVFYLKNNWYYIKG